jgi:hypothetical protein
MFFDKFDLGTFISAKKNKKLKIKKRIRIKYSESSPLENSQNKTSNPRPKPRSINCFNLDKSLFCILECFSDYRKSVSNYSKDSSIFFTSRFF